jgi:hypothetical protein
MIRQTIGCSMPLQVCANATCHAAAHWAPPCAVHRSPMPRLLLPPRPHVTPLRCQTEHDGHAISITQKGSRPPPCAVRMSPVPSLLVGHRSPQAPSRCPTALPQPPGRTAQTAAGGQTGQTAAHALRQPDQPAKRRQGGLGCGLQLTRWGLDGADRSTRLRLRQQPAQPARW